MVVKKPGDQRIVFKTIGVLTITVPCAGNGEYVSHGMPGGPRTLNWWTTTKRCTMIILRKDLGKTDFS
ncbi:MAG: hypothetical protein ACRESA_07990, partial [Gammaproteobacteria bacterium]